MKECKVCGASLDPGERCDCEWTATVKCPYCGQLQPEKFPAGTAHLYKCTNDKCKKTWILDAEGRLTF